MTLNLNTIGRRFSYSKSKVIKMRIERLEYDIFWHPDVLYLITEEVFKEFNEHYKILF